MTYRYFVLTGPTGIGKSSLGLQAAKAYALDVLSVDSMLVYRGLDIGTAKPSRQELSEVRHHLVDIIGPEETFDAQQFMEEADRVYKACHGRVIAVGGTPFYIQALRCGLPDFQVSREIENWLAQQETADLIRWLKRLDPIRFEKIHANDRFRLVRALAIALSAGKRASDHKTLQQPRTGCEMTLVALDMDRALMHQRIQERIDDMFSQGLLEEARSIYTLENLNRTAKQAVGYKELFAYFEGKMSLDEAKERILIATRQLLKHQMTWLRKMPVHWIQCDPKRPEKAWDELYPMLEAHFST